MSIITVNTNPSYKVFCNFDILSKIGEMVLELSFDKALLITDSNVDLLYSEIVLESLRSEKIKCEKVVFLAGEKSKTLSTIENIYNKAAASELTRNSLIIALGGGVVGDIAGFVAATYMRGISYIQVPTTVLAQVDSSIGGKTGFDISMGKNLVGAFWQPSMVICDINTTKSLSLDIFNDGVAEIIKTFAIQNKNMLDNIISGKPESITNLVIAECINIKKNIVERDQCEKGERKLLNFGHTIAHAIEKLSDYHISHGCAVAIGMSVITKSSEKLGLTMKGTGEQLNSIIKSWDLPIISPYSAQEIYSASITDKKRCGDQIDLVILECIGKGVIHTIEISELEQFIRLGLE